MQPLAETDPRRVGAYRLLYRLGEGGMGRVYLGRSPGGRTVALKVVHGTIASDPGFRRRFAREVRAAQSLRGAGTVPVLDADPEAEVPWLATAYVPGPALSDAVIGHGPLPQEALWRLLSGLAKALAAVHGAGLVHRDVKPSNVLLSQSGPLLIDFGIARSADETALTGTGLVVGSPGYMSPEQAEGRSVGPAGDVFSLGAVLAFAATGRGPFGSGSVAELLYRLVHHEPDLDGVGGRFGELVQHCLAKRPEDRPTVTELVAATQERTDTGPWLPPPMVAAIAHKAEELLNAEAEELEEQPEYLVRERVSGVSGPAHQPASEAVMEPDGAATTALPPHTPQPTAVLPGRSPAGPARARAASSAVSTQREAAVRALTMGLGRPLYGLFFLIPVVALLIGGFDLLDRAAQYPSESEHESGAHQWAMNDWSRFPVTLLLFGAMAWLHIYRKRLMTVPPVRVRLWSAGIGLYWITLMAGTALNLVWFMIVQEDMPYEAGDHPLLWVAMPVIIIGAGLSPVLLIASVLRIVRA
ncbi:serine/threonine-protein kinase [Streptomyces justiciae]|uniref:Serine/threonine-protein kinase n=1 Tax=Streptomyces justiciae TaxID=2780140 RepID=A0ABU3M7G5_9ACTN|nr:serine/threonine-protein kinase [Streptomyces justiciae]MDT7847471.1 serine/threonine-protein kinase [Streptomyces justiciae]